jgi:phage-related protein
VPKLSDLFVAIRADDKPASKTIAGVRKSLTTLDKQKVQPQITLPERAAADIQGLSSKLQALSRQQVKLSVDSTTAKADVATLTRQLDTLERQRVTVPVDMQGGIDRQIADVRRELSAAERKQTTIPLKLERVEGKVAAVRSTLSTLERDGVDVPVDVDKDNTLRGRMAAIRQRIAGGLRDGKEVDKAGADTGKRFGNGFGAAAKRAIGAVAVYAGISEVAGFLKDATAEGREAQKVGATTSQIIRSTGGAAKISADEVGALAQALSVKNGMDDEAIQAGANLLLTFKNVRNEAGKGSKIFDRATQSAADLSAAGFGSVSGASKMLGKALNDPVKGISALGRAGVTFTDQQKEQIKALVASGDTLGAQKIIMKEVESQVGGVAAASATAGEKMSVAFGNFKEQVGTALLPIIDRFANFMVTKGIPALSRFVKFLSDNLPAAVATVKRVVGPVVNVIRGFVESFTGSAEAASLMDRIRGAVAAASPVIVSAFKSVAGFIRDELIPRFRAIGESVRGYARVVIPIWEAVAAKLVSVIRENMPLIREIFGTIKDIVKTTMELVKAIIDRVTKIIGFIWDRWGDKILAIIGSVFKTIITVVGGALKIVRGVIQTVTALIRGDWRGAWNGIKTILSGVLQVIKGIVQGVFRQIRILIGDQMERARASLSQKLGAIRDRFSAVTSGIRQTWSNFWTRIKDTGRAAMDTVRDRIGTVLGKIKTAFSNAKTNIGKVWDGVKTVVQTPINWVKDHVYNTPLVPVWNRVAKLVGGPTLEAYARGGIDAAERYANGGTHGVRPGYTPGRDTHTIAVGGGEAIMRPEWTRAVGADYVESANRAARTGGVRKVQEMAAAFKADGEGEAGERVPQSPPGFARGGVFKAIGAKLRSAKDTAVGLAGKLKDWALGGLRAAADKVLGPVKGIIENAMPQSGLGRTVGGVGKKAIDLALDKIKSSDSTPDTGSGPYGGGGAAVGGGRGAARLAGLRLGASSVGTYPGHQPSMNKAWDFMAAGATGNRIAGHLAANRKQYGISYLIWNRRMLRDYPHGNIAPGAWGPYFDGNSSNPNRAHTNHVHASFYKDGGIVPAKGLAAGGLVKGGRGGVPAVVGEGRFDELVAPLPRGWKMGAGKDDAVDRLIATIEEHGLGDTNLNFGDIINPREETLSQSTNKIMQRVSNIGLVG